MNAGYVANVSGNYSNGLNTGAFNLNVYDAPSNSLAFVGSHLMYNYNRLANYGWWIPKGFVFQWLINSISTLPLGKT